MLLRNDGKATSVPNRLFASVRNLTGSGADPLGAGGWSTPVPTNIPDSPTRTYAGTLPDDTAWLLGTQVPGTRDPLTLSLAKNGIAFDRAFALMTAADMAPLGVDARSGFSYPGALVRNGTLFVAVAADKVTIVLARTKLASLLM